MLPVVNLAAALVLCPVYVNVVKENDVYKVAKGSSPIMFAALNIMQSLNINVTYKAASESFGDYINGNYTGLLKELETKKLDFIFYPLTPAVRNDAISISPAFDEWDHTIHSISRPAVKNDIYVISQLANIGISNWMLLIFTSLFYLLFLRCVKITLSVFDAIAMFLEQNYRETSKLKPLLLILIFSFAFMFDFITSSFSTQLVVVDLPEFAENLQDVADQKLTLYFFKDFRTHDKISKHDKHICSQIETVVANFTGFQSVMESALKSAAQSKGGVIFASFAKYCYAQMLCGYYDKKLDKYADHNQAYHTSKSIATTFVSFPVRNKLNTFALDRIKLLCHSLIDYGLFNRLKYKLFAGISLFPGDYDLCADKLLELKRQPSEQYRDIKLSNFTCTFILLLIIIDVISIVLFVEILISKYLK